METATATSVETTDSASISAHQDALERDLRAALLEGEVAKAVSIQTQLRDIPALLTATKIREVKSELRALPEQFDKLKAEEAELIELRKEPSEELAKLMEQVHEVGNRVERFNFSLGLIANERQILHERRRELNRELSRLMQEVETNGK